MSRLTRDGTARSVSRDQILRRGQEISIFPVQLTTSRIGNLIRLVLTIAICVTIHTHIHIYIRLSSGTPSSLRSKALFVFNQKRQ